jgi:hypothetical protein
MGNAMGSRPFRAAWTSAISARAFGWLLRSNGLARIILANDTSTWSRRALEFSQNEVGRRCPPMRRAVSPLRRAVRAVTLSHRPLSCMIRRDRRALRAAEVDTMVALPKRLPRRPCRSKSGRAAIS